ncbi:hypothetical protein [Pseudomonas synxantha]|uniref:hypothetical protein n=1 Tax=Pseudomonas synxantha TaxID=47883 RepID=UPI000F573720|nr:hypothetical protein [Pseudomonas synxantha]
MTIENNFRLSPDFGGSFGLSFKPPSSDGRVPPYANSLGSFRTEPSYAGNQVPRDSTVIEGEVVARLLNNFSVFEDPHSPGNISVGTLVDIISGAKTGLSADNIELAKMIFIMPGLLSKLDGMTENGKVDFESIDGNIDKRALEQLNAYHAPQRKSRREYFKMIKF